VRKTAVLFHFFFFGYKGLSTRLDRTGSAPLISRPRAVKAAPSPRPQKNDSNKKNNDGFLLHDNARCSHSYVHKQAEKTLHISPLALTGHPHSIRRMMWTPESVSTSPDISPGFSSKLARSKLGIIFPLPKWPRSPPRWALPQSLSTLASSSNLARLPSSPAATTWSLSSLTSRDASSLVIVILSHRHEAGLLDPRCFFNKCSTRTSMPRWLSSVALSGVRCLFLWAASSGLSHCVSPVCSLM